MGDPRTPEEIENAIERNREGLQQTINQIQETFSPDNIIRSVTESFRSHGGDMTKSVSSAAQANPLALALTGIGLGWLMFGTGPSAARIEDRARRMRSGADHDEDNGDEPGVHHVSVSRFSGRSTSHGDMRTARSGPRGPVPSGDGPNWMNEDDQGPSATQRARAGWRRASGSVGRGAGRVRDRSADWAERLSDGTRDMSSEARERIVAARERAVMASERASADIGRGARRAGDRAGDFFEEHPIAAGALAFAVGAAIAGALPRTRMEDDYFGEESDRLYDEAERVFREEREKAERVAGAAIDEARKVGDEVRSDAESAARRAKDEADTETRGEGSAADAVVDRVEDAADRIAGAAEKEAKKRDLGNPST